VATLHTVNKSPFERLTLQSCLGHLLPGDTVLMIEDGVIGARKGSSAAAAVAGALKSAKVCVLGPDLAARGMRPDQIIDGITVVDYAGFVDLVTNHDRTQAWL
jgi:tRNA 2-thiouridine synthesizing protein B